MSRDSYWKGDMLAQHKANSLDDKQEYDFAAFLNSSYDGSQDSQILFSRNQDIENLNHTFQEYASSPQVPIARSQSSNPYWRGVIDLPKNGFESTDYSAGRAGNVSAQARMIYNNESLLQKDHTAAALLAIFLGSFGMHKFYLGCNQAGFIMLAVSIIGSIFTFGLAFAVIALIAIIEGVIYLTKSQTEFDKIYVANQRDWF